MCGAPLEAAGLRLEVQDKAGPAPVSSLEWARKIGAGIRPDVDVKTMQAAAKMYGPFLGAMSARVAVWHELNALARKATRPPGGSSLRRWTGGGACGSCNGQEVAKELLALPIVVADATLPFEIARHFPAGPEPWPAT